jgi:hypothetical protein
MLRDSGGLRWKLGSAIRKAGGTLAFENCSLNMHTGTLIRMVQSTSLKPEDPRRPCPLNNRSQAMSCLDAGFCKRTAFEILCLSLDRWGFRLMSFTKYRRNGTDRELFAFS